MFVLLALVGGLHYIASTRHLYWYIYEFDSVVHFLGGLAIAKFFLWLYFFSGGFNPPKRSLAKFFLVAIIGTMLMSVFWEIFELFLGEAEVQQAEYAYDTMMDFVMDLLGAVVACFYGYIKEYNRQMVIKNSNEEP